MANKGHLHPYLATIVSVKSKRFHDNAWSQEIRYFVSSVNYNDAEKVTHYVRTHWPAEHNLHWMLDMAFDEDSCRISKGFADQNMAILRHISLNLLKSETGHKVGIEIKRKMADWDNDYLLKMLQIF
ncbi:MAG: putative transposase YbfD/YdcC [Colwellia sp.]